MRSYVAIFAIACLFGCEKKNGLSTEQTEERKELTAEQKNEKVDLAREQREEQQELAEKQNQDRKEVLQEVRENIDDEAKDVREERRDIPPEISDLRALVSKACEGISNQDAASCPVAPTAVHQVRNIDEGVEIQLNAKAGSETLVERRLTCYQARRKAEQAGVVFPSNSPSEVNSCLFDRTGIAVDVKDKNGALVVTIKAGDDAQVPGLRAEAHLMNRKATS